MSITKAELEQKIVELKKYKTLAEEATNLQKAIEQEIVSYMKEHELTEEFTDTSKVTYLPQERRTLDKDKVAEVLGDLANFEKVTTYNVLRIK